MSLTAIDTMTEDVSHFDTYDAYGAHGSLERMSIVASRVWRAQATGSLADYALDDLRTAFFMLQRGWHSDGASVELDIGVEWALVEAINVRAGRPILL